MPIIPIGPTGSPARYPFTSWKRFHNTFVRFVDGTEQHFRNRSRPSSCWRMQYEKQSDAELSLWLPFLEGAIGNTPTFLYIDPVTGAMHTNSRLADENVDLEQGGIEGARIQISIRNEGE